MTGEALRVLFAGSAPLDSDAPIAVDDESSALLTSIRASGVSVSVSAVTPASLDQIRLAVRREKPHVIHFAGHGGPELVELEDHRGARVHVTPISLAEAFADPDVALLVLNGCDTESIGRVVADLCEAHIVCTEDYLSHEAAARFVSSFYPLALGTSDPRAAFDTGVSFARQVAGHAPYHLIGGSRVLPRPVPGVIDVDRSFVAARRRHQAPRMIGREQQLLDLHPFMAGASTPVAWITGPPLVGISSFLQAIGAQFGWLFDTPPTEVDLRYVAEHIPASPHGDVQQTWDHVKARIDTDASLVLVDNFEKAPADAQQRLLEILREKPDAKARIVIGCAGPPDVRALAGALTVELGALSREYAYAILEQALGSARAEKHRWVLDHVPLLPGRLGIVVGDIENGVGQDRLRALLRSGDSRAGLARQVERVTGSKAAKRLSRCLVAAGPHMPREAVFAAFTRSASHTTTVDAQSSFEDAVSVLRHARLLWVSEVQAVPGHLPEAYFSVSNDFLRVAQDRIGPAPSSERKDSATALFEIALDRARDDTLSVTNDARWVSKVAQLCHELGMDGEATELGMALLHKDGSFRLSGSFAEVELLAKVSFDAARRIGEWDAAGQLGLVLGESYYKLGRVDAAADAFRQILTTQAPPGRKLQALRALGQVSYRRRDYAASLDFYQAAEEHVSEAPEDTVATLRHHRAKAYFRLHRIPEAVEDLDWVIEYRRKTNDVRSMIKAQHEMARVWQSSGELEEAEKIYHLVLSGAETVGFKKFLAPPLYQLTLLELSRARLPQARDYQARCRQVANEIEDPFWQVLADLAGAMTAHAEGRWSDSASLITSTVQQATQLGFPQVVEDARQWVRAQVEQRRTPQSAHRASEAIADMLANVEGLPARKIAKALRYAEEPHRIQSIIIRFDSESATRSVTWDGEKWSCDCDLFSQKGNCSHLVGISFMEDTPWKWSKKTM
ncbi:tetratricopeptide repeat protein [Streptomyces sp. NPDC005760]|uniref:tetratricopeptide repeat protein n=1 Tax=Streptomyces sp. NPDC005760 TaxID=3156718 RepID=UPI003402CD0D